MKLLVLAVFLIAFAIVAQTDPNLCKENEQIAGCRTCERTCARRNVPCPGLRRCIPRPPTCMCKANFFRDPAGRCVTAEECPAVQPQN